MKFRLILAAATCLALPGVAKAQPVTGPYVSLEGGTSILDSTNYNFQSFSGVNGKFLYRPSYAAAGSIGYGFGDGFRIEISHNYTRNTLTKSDPEGGGGFRSYGGENKYGPMVNILYDINVGLPVFPYVGAGAGYQFVKYDSDFKDGTGASVGGTKGSFAYDIIGGVSYPLAMVPGLSLTAEYRFMMLTSSRNYNAAVDGIPVGFEKTGQESSHTFLAGLRYQILDRKSVV